MTRKKQRDQPHVKVDNEQRFLEEITALLTHKLRNPLGGIKGFASLLERDLENSPNLQKMAGKIVEGTDSINNILCRLTEYAAPLELEYEEANLAEFIHNFFSSVKFPNTITLSLSIPEEPMMTSIDRALFQQALSILFSNALCSSHSEGNITISFKATNQQAAITIANTGAGIPEHQKSQAFSPFFVPAYGGKEGDLAAARKIIRAHGGSIALLFDENYKNIFRIHLPLKMRSTDVN